ncbi:hypothetical protein D3C86_1766480 [compost metagenome]
MRRPPGLHEGGFSDGAGCGRLRRKLGELLLDRLELADRAAELDTFVGVLGAHLGQPSECAGYLARADQGAA